MSKEEKKIKIEDGDVKSSEHAQGNSQENHSDAHEEKKPKEEKEQQDVPEVDPLEDAKQQLADLKDKYLRTAAEFDNYRKRISKEKAELILNGGAKTVTAILPILDDFERALADKSEDPQAIRKGVELIYHKFVKTLEGLGVKKIDTKDKDFDVDYHEAVAMVPGMGDDKKGKVIDCVQTGYTMNDKVLRHAKVAVGQ